MSSNRARGAPGRRPPLLSIGRSAAVLAMMAALLAFLVPVTAAGIFRRVNPDWALRLAPWDARANAAVARRSLLQQRRRGLPHVTDKARQAYRRDPLAIEAVTTLALAAAVGGQQRRASVLFRYGERLTRREPEAELWLVEEAVRRNDVPGALRHYDVLLRTTPRLQEMLFPILIDASSSDAIARELNRLLATHPGWDREFLTHLAYRGRNPDAIVRVSHGLLRPEVAEDREILLILLGRLVSLHRFDLAWSVYDDLSQGAPGARALLRDGNFASDGGMPPFDWEFSRESELVPERHSRDTGAGYALYLPASPSAHGESARQLLRLPPGRYQLRAMTGNVPAEPGRRPFVSLSCAAPSAVGLMELDFPQAPAAGRALAGSFSVPEACRYQWLSIWVRGDPDADEEFAVPGGDGPWVGSIALRRH